MSHAVNTAATVASVGGVIVLSAWGGVVRYLQGLKAEEFSHSWFCFYTEITTSAFVGVLIYVLCEAWQVDHFITAAAVALAGHEGGRTLYVIHAALARRIRILKMLEQKCGSKNSVSCDSPEREDPTGRDV